MKKIGLVLMVSLMLSSCSFVKMTPAGEKTRVLSKNEVYGCKKLGQTTVSLLDKVVGYERNEKRVQKELETLARNSAPDLKADTVVPAGAVVNGEQTFDLYRCVNPWQGSH